MAEAIIITPNNISDPTGCMPGNRQELANFVSTAFTAMFAGGSFSFFNYGHSVPAVENQDRPWFRLEASGFPVGWYSFYNGKWIRAAGIPVGSEVFYSGSSNVFDGTGKGRAGTQADGFVLSNGNNGTVDKTDKFIVVSSGFRSGQWQSDITGSFVGTGGQAQVTLVKANLPKLQGTLPTGNSTSGDTGFVFKSTTASSTFTFGIPGTGNGETGADNAAVPHNNIPPFYVSALMVYNPLA